MADNDKIIPDNDLYSDPQGFLMNHTLYPSLRREGSGTPGNAIVSIQADRQVIGDYDTYTWQAVNSSGAVVPIIVQQIPRKNGVTFTPSIENGVLSWSNDGGLPNPPSVNIIGEKGDPGTDGTNGKNGTTFTPSVSTSGVISWNNDGGLENPAPVDIKGAKGDRGNDGTNGSNGYTFTPSVSSDGTLSWSNDGGLSNPASVNIKGGKGDPGTDGTNGKNGTTFTPSVSPSGVISWTNDGGLENPSPVDIKGSTGTPGSDGINGENGTTFTPSVSSDGTLSWSNDGGLANPASVNIKGGKGDPGNPGAKGATFTPSVSSDGTLSWSNDGGLANPASVNIKGGKGDPGENGGTPFFYNPIVTSVSEDNSGVTSVTGTIGRDGTDPLGYRITFDFKNIKGENAFKPSIRKPYSAIYGGRAQGLFSSSGTSSAFNLVTVRPTNFGTKVDSNYASDLRAEKGDVISIDGNITLVCTGASGTQQASITFISDLIGSDFEWILAQASSGNNTVYSVQSLKGSGVAGTNLHISFHADYLVASGSKDLSSFVSQVANINCDVTVYSAYVNICSVKLQKAM